MAVLHKRTRELIEAWCREPGHPVLEAVRLDAYPHESKLPTVEVTVIFGGALDEEFYLGEEFAVFICEQVLVPDVRAEAKNQCNPDTEEPEIWTVIVQRVIGRDGELREPEEIRRWDSQDSQ